MEETNSETRKTSGRRWGRRVLWIGVGAAIVLLVGYGVVASEFFAKRILLPRLGDAFESEITASEVAFRPFGSIRLTGARLVPKEEEWLLDSEGVTVRYQFWPLLRGELWAEEIILDQPTVAVIQRADGSSNLDPLLRAMEEDDPDEEESAWQIGRLSIQGGEGRWIRESADGAAREVEWSDFSVEARNIGPDQRGDLEMTSGLTLRRESASGGAGPHLAGNGEASATFTLGPSLELNDLQSESSLVVTESAGEWEALSGLQAGGNLQLASGRELALSLDFADDTQKLGRLDASGTIETETGDADLQYEIQGLDEKVLALAGAFFGIGLESAPLHADGRIRLAEEGQTIDLQGQGAVSEVRLRQEEAWSPQLDLEWRYEGRLDLKAATLTVESVDLRAHQDNEPVFQAELSEPVTIDWGSDRMASTPSTLEVNVDGLDLAEWEPWFGRSLPVRRVDLSLRSKMAEAGRDIEFELSGGAELAGDSADSRVPRDGGQAAFRAEGGMVDLNEARLDDWAVEVSSPGGDELLSLNGAARYIHAEAGLELQASFDAAIPNLLGRYPVADLNVGNGAVSGELQYAKNGDRHQAEGQVRVVQLQGAYADIEVADQSAMLDYQLEKEGQQLRIQRAALQFRPEGASAGTLSVAGAYDLDGHSGELEIGMDEITEAAWRPFVEQASQAEMIRSVTLTGETSLAFDDKGAGRLAGDWDVSNLSFRSEPGRAVTPLEVGVVLEGTWDDERWQIDPMTVQWPETSGSDNTIRVTAHFPGDAETNRVVVRSKAVDLTPWYNHLEGVSFPESDEASSSEDDRSGSEEGPYSPLHVDVNVERFDLRSLVLTELVAKAQLEDGRMTMDPLQFHLNGTPVEGRLSMDTAEEPVGYRLFVQGDRIPLEPWIASFYPQFRGRVKGELRVDGEVEGHGGAPGAGIPSLYGKLDVAVTEGEIQVIPPGFDQVMSPIAKLLRLPQILKTPIHSVDLQTQMRGGRARIESLKVASGAFLARSDGEIRWASPLGDSRLDLSLQLALERSLARRSNLSPKDATEEDPYIDLPRFASIEGTLNDPETEIDELAIADLLSRSASGLPGEAGKAGKAAEKILKGFRDLLGPQEEEEGEDDGGSSPQ